MGLRLDDNDSDRVNTTVVGTVVPVAPLEFPRHAKIDHDSKVHTFDEFYEQTKGEESPHEEEEDDVDATLEDRQVNDKKPLLQEMKATRTSSKRKMKDAAAKAKLLSTSSSGGVSPPTMIPVTSASPTLAARMKRLRGLGYIVFAALNISLMSACIKFATHHVTSHEAVFWRTFLTWILNVGVVRANKVSMYVAPAHRKILLFRCFIGMTCISLSYYAFSKMVLTDAIVIIFTSPVLTFVLGALLLGEAIERVDFLCALISYVGVLFVTRPAMLFPQDASTKPTDSLAVLCALGAAATQAGAYIAMRKLHEVHYMVVSHYFSLFGIPFSLITMAVFGAPLRIPELFSVQLALIASACFSCVGMLFLTLGFQMEKAGIASVMRYCDVVFVFILDTTFLGEDVDSYSILGGGIILSGAVMIAIKRARAKK